MSAPSFIIRPEDPVLITGASGFIGARVVECLIQYGFRNLRCLVRSPGGGEKLEALARRFGNGVKVEILCGNLLSPEDCAAATKDVAVIYHLAAGRGEKLVADAFMNSVITTRNLLQACVGQSSLKRVVNVSSFTVYTNSNKPKGGVLDERCPVETRPQLRGDAYTFAKVMQDEIVAEFGGKYDIPYVIVRPGYVYGPGREGITGRVGLGTFGIFLHLGGSNSIPFTYVDNCAEAIVLAGLKPGVDGEVFNVVDDDLPSSRWFLRQYKRNVRPFRSIYVPRIFSYLLCYLWEKYSDWSEGQLPPVYNRLEWHAYWKKTNYSNAALKRRLGWSPKVPSAEAFRRYFESCRRKLNHA